MTLPKGISSGISISSNVYMHKASKSFLVAKKSAAALKAVPNGSSNWFQTNIQGLVLHDDDRGGREYDGADA